MTCYEGRNSEDMHHSSGSLRKNSDAFLLPEEYNARGMRGRGRSIKTEEAEGPSSSRGRSLSMARTSSARSQSKQPADRSVVPSRSSRGRSLSMARSARSASRAPSKSRTASSVDCSKSEELSRSRSARSKSRARSQSRSRVEPADAGALVPVHKQSAYVEEEPRSLSSSLVQRTSSGGSQNHGSRKFMVEIDPETNDIIGVQEMSDEEVLDSSGSGGAERNSRGRLAETYKPARARSRSILRSSSHKSSITSQGERVKFAMDSESEDERRSSCVAEESTNRQGRGRSMSMQDQGTRQSRSLSRQRIEFNDVDFDPKPDIRNTQAHGNLMEILEKPARPYEHHSANHRKTSVTISGFTEETLTIDEEDDDDDSFGYSFGTHTMTDMMNQYSTGNVVDEEDGTVLSGCPSYTDQCYDRKPRNHAHQDPMRRSMPKNQSPSSSFKKKLKPVSFHIRKTKTAPHHHDSRGSHGTEGTNASTDEEGEKSPNLFVNRAADSLMLHQKQQLSESEGKEKSGKSKSRLSRLLHR